MSKPKVPRARTLGNYLFPLYCSVLSRSYPPVISCKAELFRRRVGQGFAEDVPVFLHRTSFLSSSAIQLTHSSSKHENISTASDGHAHCRWVGEGLQAGTDGSAAAHPAIPEVASSTPQTSTSGHAITRRRIYQERVQGAPERGESSAYCMKKRYGETGGFCADSLQIGFLTEWQMYAQKLEGESWKGERMDMAKVEKMSGMLPGALYFYFGC